MYYTLIFQFIECDYIQTYVCGVFSNKTSAEKTIEEYLSRGMIKENMLCEVVRKDFHIVSCWLDVPMCRQI